MMAKSTRTDPDPQVFLKGFCDIKGPNNTASHFHEVEASVLIVTAFSINMAEIVRKFSGVGPRETARKFLHVLIDYNVPAL